KCGIFPYLPVMAGLDPAIHAGQGAKLRRDHARLDGPMLVEHDQVTGLSEIDQFRGDVEAATKRNQADKCSRPGEPSTSAFFSAKDRDAKKVVKAAAVD